MSIIYRFEGDNLVKDTKVQSDGQCAIYKSEVVLSKEAFIECYNKWIKQEV